MKETVEVRSRQYQVNLEKDDDSLWWCITCPALPAAISGGRTLQEALVNIREAIELCIDSGDKPQ